MITSLEFANLELDLSQWEKQISPSINSVLSDALEIASGPNGELIFTNASAAKMGGGLIARHLPFPNLTLPYVELYLEFCVPKWSLPFLGRLECDLKASQTAAPAGSVIQNIADGSAQLNLSKAGGTWDIDAVTLDAAANVTHAGWADTPYAPGPPQPDVWTPLSIKQFYDFPNKKTSMLSIAQGSDQPFIIPASMQNQPMLFTNWAAGLHAQIQTEVMESGACTVMYRNITVRMKSTKF